MRRVAIFGALLFCGIGLGVGLLHPEGERRPSIPIDRPPRIDPDYGDLLIPPNIAPLHFLIREPGKRYEVWVSGTSGDGFRVVSRSPKIAFPLRKWRRLLEANRGGEIRFEVQIEEGSQGWKCFVPIRNRVSETPIDGYLVYRRSEPIYVWSKNMGIYQRNLSNFEEKTLLHHRTLKACMNCHAFSQNDPDRMLVHLRYGPAAGTLFSFNGRLVKVDTRSAFNPAPGAYRSWHPDGRRVAFSVNVVRQFFHAVGDVREAYDAGSDVVVYDVAQNRITGTPQLARLEWMETYPEWSHDGRFLYFCRAPAIDHSRDIKYQYHTIFYDLMRIAYDPTTGQWGDVETVLRSSDVKGSIAHPKCSPDGRFLLFCVQPYGTFTLFRPGGDLYLLDLKEGSWRRLEINSELPDSYHAWSHEGRWFVFSSKRQNGICTLTYIAHVDEAGRVSKPFLVPQKDPTYHAHHFDTYNVPELVRGPVRIRPKAFDRAALSPRSVLKPELDPALGVREITGASPKPVSRPIQ